MPSSEYEMPVIVLEATEIVGTVKVPYEFESFGFRVTDMISVPIYDTTATVVKKTSHQMAPPLPAATARAGPLPHSSNSSSSRATDDSYIPMVHAAILLPEKRKSVSHDTDHRTKKRRCNK